MDENPYELRSLNQSLQQPKAHNDLPHHAKIGEQIGPIGREAMLSPSVYSRASDGASPQPFIPVEDSGMVVTITGREVKSYAISPPKPETKQRPAQTSGQWRRWLSDEMSGFKSAGEDFSLVQAFLKGDITDRSRSTSAEQTTHGDGARRTSVVPAMNGRPASTTISARPDSTATGRPRASSRRSSFMNERYPIVDSLRNSSGESITSKNIRSRAGSSSEREHTVQSISDRQSQRQAIPRNRVVTGRASIAQMQSIPTDESVQTSEHNAQDYNMSGALPRHNDQPTVTSVKHSVPPSEHQAKKANKHKSAYELRANYKSSSTGRSTPLEIRRRPTPGDTVNMLEDNTIRNISAGPYASNHVPAARKSSTHGHHTTNDNKENTSPAADTGSGLPALSSSEWLAAGAPNKSRTPSAVHPAYRKRSVSRYSPAKGASSAGGGGKGSPAQRMASEWLEKRSRESTPAFV
ncbi:hypothetical protein LTR74_006507 [Friedmanniomyces endolithicus]|nr:hypothetical protein LTR74_006507 [Friedmanniomyces endolithicus]